MADYRDIDKMLDYLQETVEGKDWVRSQFSADWVYSFIESQPIADVVEVVRCKDCKHCQQYQKWNFDKYLGCNFNGEIYEVEPNHFCAHGERKETNDR